MIYNVPSPRHRTAPHDVGWSGPGLHRVNEQVYRVAKKPERKQDETPDFEHSLQELEAIVARLEQGDLPLEESLRQFERGIALTRACQQSLKTAEQKVQILIEENGKTDTRAFTDETED
ncbi:MAG: exodeoxyribonuclease VII small subunit [Gammaproteobacteria bacterium]|nr:exodeoxyribonuclease VII small subunit [Gammaproteobacteria bacterium]